MSGGAGDDNIEGNQDNDILYGDEGNDRIRGGIGDDKLIGGLGIDVLIGAVGKDIFVLENLADSTTNASDVILDFVKGEDLIDLSGLGFSSISQLGSGTTSSLTYGFEGSNTIIQNSDNNFKITLSGIINLTDYDFDFS